MRNRSGWSAVALSGILALGCGTTKAATTEGGEDVAVDTVAADASDGNGTDAATSDTATSDATADAAAGDASGATDATTGNDVPSGADTGAQACSDKPVTVSYTASAISTDSKLVATTWDAKGVSGGATYIKSIKQIQMAALTAAGPGSTPPCLHLDISLTFAAEPVVGKVYPIGIGADTANVDLNEFTGCDVGKMITWNALVAPKKAGSVKLTAWDGKMISVEFTGVLLPAATPGVGSFTLDGKYSTDCVKTQ